MCVTCAIPTSASKRSCQGVGDRPISEKMESTFPSDEGLLREEWHAGQGPKTNHRPTCTLRVLCCSYTGPEHRPVATDAVAAPAIYSLTISSVAGCYRSLLEEEHCAASAERSRLGADGLSSKRRSFPTKHPAGEIRSVGSGQSWDADWHNSLPSRIRRDNRRQIDRACP